MWFKRGNARLESGKLEHDPGYRVYLHLAEIIIFGFLPNGIGFSTLDAGQL